MAFWHWAHSDKCFFSFIFQNEPLFRCWKAKVWNCHATRPQRKTTIYTSVVYGQKWELQGGEGIAVLISSAWLKLTDYSDIVTRLTPSNGPGFSRSRRADNDVARRFGSENPQIGAVWKHKEKKVWGEQAIREQGLPHVTVYLWIVYFLSGVFSLSAQSVCV